MKIVAEKKMIPVLVKIDSPSGPRWEWQQVEGFEVEFPTPHDLKSGETLDIEYTIIC